MTPDALNSLAEVGVGLNLAFSLLNSIRNLIFDLFQRVFSSQEERIIAALEEIMQGTGNCSIGTEPDESESVTNLRHLLSELRIKYRKHSELVIKIAVVLASVISMALLWFLAEASTMNHEIPEYWAWLTLFLVVFPLAFTFLLHFIILSFYSTRMWKYSYGFDIVAAMVRRVRKPIEPLDPMNEEMESEDNIEHEDTDVK
ncbi:hypothetical protein [Candidatus Thiodiazotropha sp. LNASS1]|uniref:hypothetical protein n=1 Tax=Candidatus Thiodiazotropha sp. LNASS1 TaxID=3096260 RepID=UPI0034DF1A7B